MKCKKCGYKTEKGWQFCPICSEPIKKKHNIVLKVGIAILVIFLFNVIYTNSLTNEQRVKKYLKNQYNEKFYNITLVQAVENSDSSIDCDGAHFYTIKGKGNTEYYLAYSKKNDLEFTVTYNTYTKECEDSYNSSLNIRNEALLIYQETSKTFEQYIKKFGLLEYSSNETLSTITSTKDITDILSNVSDNYPQEYNKYPYPELRLYINMNSLEFCQQEYNNIKSIHNYIRKIMEDNDDNNFVSFNIYTLDNFYLEFNDSNNVYVYDMNRNEFVRRETIEDFMQRDSY